jgi:hypothetical protein
MLRVVAFFVIPIVSALVQTAEGPVLPIQGKLDQTGAEDPTQTQGVSAPP